MQVKIQIRTIRHLLSSALPDFLGRIPFTDNRVLLTVETPDAELVPPQGRVLFPHDLRRLGLVALLLPPTTGHTASLGPALGNLRLTPRRG